MKTTSPDEDDPDRPRRGKPGPRKIIGMSARMVEQVLDYKVAAGLETEAAAFRKLLRLALDSVTADDAKVRR
jgi:hypothetical protein